MNTPARTPFEKLPAPQQAGILCNDPRFQKFAALRCGFADTQFSASATRHYVLDVCTIDSRKDLATNKAASKMFQALRTEFDAWTGKIATPR